MSFILNPLSVYVLIAFLSCDNMESIYQSGRTSAVLKPIFCDIECRKGIPLIKIMSMNNRTSLCMVLRADGTFCRGMDSIDVGLLYSFLPQTIPNSCPNICSAILSSSDVYRQFNNKLLSNMYQKCCLPSLPTLTNNSLTPSARFIWVSLYKDLFEATVCTKE